MLENRRMFGESRQPAGHPSTSGDFTGERRCSGNVIGDFVISARGIPRRVTVPVPSVNGEQNLLRVSVHNFDTILGEILETRNFENCGILGKWDVYCHRCFLPYYFLAVSYDDKRRVHSLV